MSVAAVEIEPRYNSDNGQYAALLNNLLGRGVVGQLNVLRSVRIVNIEFSHPTTMGTSAVRALSICLLTELPAMKMT
jgi:hypothetical protein